MRPTTSIVRVLVGAGALALAAPTLGGCAFLNGLVGRKQAAPDPESRKPLLVQTLSETSASNAVLPVGNTLWVATNDGLQRWDMQKGTMKRLGAADGLPADRILGVAVDGKGALWVVTPAGVAHEEKKGWAKLPPAPVGSPITGVVVADDGLFVGGPEGLAKLQKGTWGRMLGDTAVTAMATYGRDLWVGTKGKGVVHVAGEQVEVYATDQGCETETVRGLAATPSGVMAVGDGPGGERVAFFDGVRFYSYKVDLPPRVALEWIRRVGDHAFIGAGAQLYDLQRLAPTDSLPASAIRVTPVDPRFLKPAPTGPARRDLPGPTSTDTALSAAMAPPPPPPPPAPAATKSAARAAKGGGKAAAPAAKGDGKAAAPAAKGDGKAAAPAAKGDGKAATIADGKTAAPVDGKTPPPAAPVAPPAPAAPPVPKYDDPPPAWVLSKWGPTLPEGVATVGSDGATLVVGTRFLGAAKIEQAGITPFATYDLAADAERLTVACDAPASCWIATGTTKAWRWDGQSLAPANIDPERGAKILAIVSHPKGAVMAIHAGAADRFLRISSATTDGTWSPTGMTQIEVPTGVPAVSFAGYAPTGKLWMGLRYVDKNGDQEDYGAAEVDLDHFAVTYHRKGGGLGERSRPLPNDVESGWFPSANEEWFGTRAGAIHVNGNKLVTYGENEGLEREIVHGMLEGPDGKVWAATAHGVAKFDGVRWQFPPEGDPLHVRANSLAKDRLGTIFVGHSGGVIAVRSTGVEAIDSKRGLLDNRVIDLLADRQGRIWVLTEKGISIITR